MKNAQWFENNDNGYKGWHIYLHAYYEHRRGLTISVSPPPSTRTSKKLQQQQLIINLGLIKGYINI